MTEANQNFTKVGRLVDEKGMAVILKNNKPRYILVDFEEYEDLQKLRQKLITDTADKVIEDNLGAFFELGK